MPKKMRMTIRTQKIKRLKSGKIVKAGRARIRTVTPKKMSGEDFFGDMKPKSKKLSVDMKKKKRMVGKRGKKLGLK